MFCENDESVEFSCQIENKACVVVEVDYIAFISGLEKDGSVWSVRVESIVN